MSSPLRQPTAAIAPGAAVSLKCQIGKHDACNHRAVNNLYERVLCSCACHREGADA